MAQTVEIPNVTVVRETDKAILCQLEEDGEEVWVPQSLVDEASEVWKAKDEGTLVVPKWFAKKTDALRDYVED
jgi:hypothetical protein